MAPVQTQTVTAHQFSNPITVLSGRVSKPAISNPTFSKPATRTTTRTTSTPSNKSLISYSPQIPSPHPDIPISLLRNKLLLTCRPYVPSSLIAPALADGIYSRATHWITNKSLVASRHGKSKRYYVLHTSDFTLQQVSSSWEARIASGGSRPIDAGNGVVLFVRERKEWQRFMQGYRRQGKRAGELLRTREKDVERHWREGWRRRCGLEQEERKEGAQGPYWVLVRSGVERIRRGEA